MKPEGKALAMLLYGRGTESQRKLKASYGFISKLLNVSRTAVLKWIRSISPRLSEPEMDDTIKEIQVDEMWHFINKKWVWRVLDCVRNKTVGWFRTALTQANAYESLFKEINAQLEAHHIIVKKGVLVVASVVETSLKPRGKTPYKVSEDRTEQTETTVEKQYPERVEKEASWLKKRGKYHYDYKKH